MRGNNRLLLNTATVIEAVQMYFDHKFKEKAPVVTNVDIVSYKGSDYFEVLTTDAKEHA